MALNRIELIATRTRHKPKYNRGLYLLFPWVTLSHTWPPDIPHPSFLPSSVSVVCGQLRHFLIPRVYRHKYSPLPCFSLCLSPSQNSTAQHRSTGACLWVKAQETATKSRITIIFFIHSTIYSSSKRNSSGHSPINRNILTHFHFHSSPSTKLLCRRGKWREMRAGRGVHRVFLISVFSELIRSPPLLSSSLACCYLLFPTLSGVPLLIVASSLVSSYQLTQ